MAMSITRRKFGIITAGIAVAVTDGSKGSDGDVYESGTLQGDSRTRLFPG
jgi:hypothetical protein